MRKIARFWEKHPSGVRCLLCPNYCVIAENQYGKCRKRRNMEGDLIAENYCQTISMNLDPMEKKPLYHFHPGEYILSLGSNSCNLTCKFCQNYTSSQYECETMYLRPESLLHFCQNNSIKHVAFTYTEPFTWFEYVYQCALLLRKKNISVVLVTNGYVNLDPLNFLLPHISAMNIDLKAFNDKFYRDICGGKLQPVLDVIAIAQAKTHVELTFLMIESLNDNLSELHNMFAFIQNLNPNIPLHISKYFPRYKMNIKETNEQKLHRVAQIAESYLKNVYLGNVRS